MDGAFGAHPVMDGEFPCEESTARVDAIGGGNFILLGRSLELVSIACRTAVAAISRLPDVITPFPGARCAAAAKWVRNTKACLLRPTMRFVPRCED